MRIVLTIEFGADEEARSHGGGGTLAAGKQPVLPVMSNSAQQLCWDSPIMRSYRRYLRCLALHFSYWCHAQRFAGHRQAPAIALVETLHIARIVCQPALSRRHCRSGGGNQNRRSTPFLDTCCRLCQQETVLLTTPLIH